MSAKLSSWFSSCVAIALLAVAGGPAFAVPAPEPIKLPAAAAVAVKEAFPNSEVGTVALTKDLGLHVYIVELTGDSNVNSAEVTPEGVIVFATQSFGPSELPEAVAKVALPEGFNFASANKHEMRADLKPGKAKFEKLAKPSFVYEVTVSKDFQDYQTVAEESGKVVSPLTQIARASAVVPAGKFVLRVNCGADVDYTDRSGVTWSADHEYAKGKTTWGGLGGKTAQRTGLRVTGTDAPGIYDCERYKMGTYQFDVPNGKYTIRMHNCESWEGAKDVGVRVFAVKANGKVVIERTDVAKDAGFIKPLVKEAKDIEVTDGKLVIEPYPTRTDNDQHPFVNAYEIIAQ